MTGYIGGLSSGLDTAAMIEQLMQVERAPIQRLQQNRKSYETKDEAWTGISTRLSGLRTALDALASQSDLEGLISAETSHSGRLSASATGPAEPQTVQLSVDQLATKHEVISTGSFASPNSLVGAGTFTLTMDGVDHDVVTDASTNLDGLASAINDLDAGVNASVIMVDESNAELRLVASGTGATSSFTASGDQTGLDAFSVVRTGQDAQLTMGSLTLTRSTNSIDDLVPGVTLELLASGTEEITITVGRDHDAAAGAVEEVVSQLNSAIGQIKELTAFDAESGTAGPLLGDATARRLLMDLQSALSTVTTDDPTYTHASTVGIEVERDGTITLDETKLRTALEDDFEAVTRLLSRTGSTTDTRLEHVRSTDATPDGTYAVEITQGAEVAGITGAGYTAPGGDIDFQVTSGEVTAAVTVAAGSTLAEAIDAINGALSAAGISTIEADEDAGAIRLRETRHGSSVSYEVAGSDTLDLDGVHQGTDVEGTIDGEPATGSGRLLIAEGGSADGLWARVLASQDEVVGAGGNLAVGDVTVSGGLVGSLSSVMSAAEGADGSISRARDHWASQIELVDDRIESFEDRLVRVEERLVRQFTAMEQALAQLQSQQSWMQSQLPGMGEGGG